jgi:hypothetical protein
VREQPSREWFDRQRWLAEEAEEAALWVDTPNQLRLFTWCNGPIHGKYRRWGDNRARLYLLENETLRYNLRMTVPARRSLFVGDPFRFGHPLPVGTPIDKYSRCGVCRRLNKMNPPPLTEEQRARGKKDPLPLTQGQRAIEAGTLLAVRGRAAEPPRRASQEAAETR